MAAPEDDVEPGRADAIDVHVDFQGLAHAGRSHPARSGQFLFAELRKSLLVHRSSRTPEEESVCLGEKHGYFFVVAEDSGGEEDREEPKTLAVEEVVRYMLDVVELGAQDERSCVPEECHAAIRRGAARLRGFRDMTTFTMAYVLWPRLYAVRAGDSQCFLGRSSRLELTATDHTGVRPLADSGAPVFEPGHEPPSISGSWDPRGGHPEMTPPVVHRCRLKIGDSLLMSTGGLARHVTEDAIARLLATSRSAQESCRRLVEAASEAGGGGGITVGVAEFL